ncbi:MAG: hypothetical protein ABIQ70_11740 [Dokdonella sp.]
MSIESKRDLAACLLLLALIIGSPTIFASNGSWTNIGESASVVVRVEGLALGSQVQFSRSGEVLTANLNDDYSFSTPALPGSALGIAVVTQPQGQACAVSDIAPITVPSDSSPVFVRCRSVPVPSTVVPETLPDDPLRVLRGASAVRGIAYPGLPYESRLGVVGGTFPYEFRVTAVSMGGTPVPASSVSMDFRHGTLRFTPATAMSITIEVEIRDSAATQHVLTHSIAIQAATAPFVFVATDGIDSAGRGSLAQPYRTLGYALPKTSASQAIILRRGSYLTGGFTIDDAHAKTILAYPDEVPEIDLNYAGAITVRIQQLPGARLEGIDIRHVEQYGIFSDPSISGLVLRHLRFVEGREGSTPSENPAFVHANGDSAPTSRHALIVQDSDFGSFQMLSSGAYALTLYDVGDSLTENNQIHLGATTGGIHDKDNSQGNTYRENYIAFSAANANGNGIQASAQANSIDVHIHHNLLINTGIRLGLQCFQETCYMRNHDVHHNTIVGASLTFGWGVFNPTSFGTRFSHNIIDSGSAAPYAWHACLSSVPAAFDTQVGTGANLFQTTSSLAMHDDECNGGPMDMSWSTWRNTHGMDTAQSGSVVTSTNALIGSGPTLGLPATDPRRPALGHLYEVAQNIQDVIFANGFD